MSDFLERLRGEFSELSDRVSKLRDFLGSETFESLVDEQRDLLSRQFELMRQYMRVLGRRLELLDAESTEEVAAGVSEVEASAAIYPVWPDAAAIIATGLSDETKESLTKAGFLTVGAFREAVRSKLEDGGCVQDLPGVTPENSAEIEAKLLNDRPAGNYLTGESAGEGPVDGWVV